MQKLRELINKIETGQQALSFTALSRFMSSPRDFTRYKLRDNKKTPAMLEGQYAHARLLNPCFVPNEYYIGKKIKGDSRTRLTEANAMNGARYAYNVRMHSQYKSIRQTARRVETIEEITLEGFKFRRVLDIDGYDKIYDIKTMGASDITPRKFKWKIYDFNYHVQAAIYVAQYDNIADNILNIDTLPDFYWIVVTKTDCVIMQCHKDFIVAGFHRLQQALSDWNKCIAADAWMQGSEFYLTEEQLVIRP